MRYLIITLLVASCAIPPKNTPDRRFKKVNIMDKVIKCADKFINMGVDADIAFTQCKSVYGVKRWNWKLNMILEISF